MSIAESAITPELTAVRVLPLKSGRSPGDSDGMSGKVDRATGEPNINRASWKMGTYRWHCSLASVFGKETEGN